MFDALILFTQAQAQQPGVLQMFMPFAIVLGIFYVILIRPQQQARKRHEAMVAGLTKHDEVVTAGGVHGTVINLKQDTVVLKIDDSSRMTVDRSRIERVVKRAGGSAT